MLFGEPETMLGDQRRHHGKDGRRPSGTESCNRSQWSDRADLGPGPGATLTFAEEVPERLVVADFGWPGQLRVEVPPDTVHLDVGSDAVFTTFRPKKNEHLPFGG